MVSLDEFVQFVDSLTNFKELPNGDIIFTGTISYRLHKKIVNSITCEIRLHRSSVEYGVITFSTEDNTYVNKYQPRFDPNWQDYEFDPANKILIVSGNSIKLGDYKVEICELALP
jgi:2-keto-4-pentenoate hydratase/2-oxohepta-3-ene-1,7-dioic acid hydratase in catechol pathway